MSTLTDPKSKDQAEFPLGPNRMHAIGDPTIVIPGISTDDTIKDTTPNQPANARVEKLSNGISWPVLGWIVLIHAGVLFAPFCFTWEALALTVVLHWMTGGIGICLGYHRLLTHGSFKTFAPVRWCLGVLGCLAGEGSPTDWVANHRKHHAHSDEDGDPHTPNDGGWWSHIFWIVWATPDPARKKHVQRWAPDILNDRVLAVMDVAFIPLNLAFAGLLFSLGYWLGGLTLATSFVVWGMFTRLAFVMHSTWFVNSASHIWGYRNYDTKDNSRNCWWVALLAYGEGWHNNHHAYPSMAKHGHRWWEIDSTFLVIRIMRRLGLAWHVVDYKQRQELAT